MLLHLNLDNSKIRTSSDWLLLAKKCFEQQAGETSAQTELCV